MYARTSTWTGSAEALEKWVQHVEKSVAPMVAGLAGNAGHTSAPTGRVDARSR